MAVVINVVSQFNGKQIKTAIRSLDDFKKAAARAGGGLGGSMVVAGQSIDAVGKKLSNVGGAMTKNVTMPIVGIGIASVKAFNEVDDALDNVTAKSGLTGSAVKGLEGSFKKVAANATQDLGTVGNVMGTLAAKTKTTGKPLETLSSAVLDFSQIMNVDATAAAESITTGMAALGIKAKDGTGFIDILTTATQKYGVQSETLLTALTQSAPTMRAFGISTKSATTIMASLTKAGLPTSRIITGLNSAFVHFKKDGIKDMPKALGDVFTKIKNAKTPTEATALAVDTFGARTGVTLADSIRRGVISLEDMTGALDNSKGALGRTKKETDGASEEFKRMQNQLTLAGADIGAKLMPYLLKGAELIKQWIAKFQSLSPKTQDLIVKIAALSAVVGPALVVVGKLTSGVGKTVKTMGSAVRATSGFVKGVRNVSAASAKGASGATKFGAAVRKGGSAMASGVKSAATFVASIAKQGAAMVVSAVKIGINTAATVASTIASKAAAAAARVWAIAQAALNVVLTMNPIGLVVLAIVALIAVFVLIYKHSAKVREVIGKAFTAMKEKVVKVFNTVKDFVLKYHPIAILFRAVKAAAPKVLAWFKSLPATLIGFFTTIKTKFMNVGKNIIGGVKSGIKNAWASFKQFFVKLIASPIQWAKEVLGIASPSKEFAKIGDFMVQGIGKGFKGDKLKKFVKDATAMALTGAREGLSKLKETAKEALDFANGIKSSLTDFGAITGAQGGDGFTPNAKGYIASMKQRLNTIKTFGKNLKGLQKLGLNNASLQEIVAAGPEAGNEIAKALLAQGKSAISQVNQLERQLGAAAGGVANTATQSQYGMSTAQARGVLTTSVSVQRGAIVVNFGKNVSKSDAAEISAIVNTAVSKALVQAGKNAGRAKK